MKNTNIYKYLEIELKRLEDKGQLNLPASKIQKGLDRPRTKQDALYQFSVDVYQKKLLKPTHRYKGVSKVIIDSIASQVSVEEAEVMMIAEAAYE